jgi:hypothetical protein
MQRSKVATKAGKVSAMNAAVVVENNMHHFADVNL